MKKFKIITQTQTSSISLIFLLSLLFFMVPFTLIAQLTSNKKLLKPEDYDLWHKLVAPQISGDGIWSSYQLMYQTAQDSLIVKNHNGKVTYEFPNSYDGQFDLNDNTTIFAFKNPEKGVGILQLKTGEVEWTSADRFTFSRDGKYLAYYSLKKQDGYLNLLDIKNNKTTTIQGVQEFSFNPSGKKAIIIINENNKTKIALLDLKSMRQTIILENTMVEFLYPTWNNEGNAIAFIENTHTSKPRLIYFEDSKPQTLKIIDETYVKIQRHLQEGDSPISNTLAELDLSSFENLKIAKREISISKDGERIFFWAHQSNEYPEKSNDSIKVQVWKGTDNWIYPQQKNKGYIQKYHLTVWWPKTGKVLQIESPERPKTILTEDKKHAISYSPYQYKDSNEADFYITNLETGIVKLLEEKINTGVGYIHMSPNGKHIAYFKDKNWWIYTVENNKHQNITVKIPTSFQYQYAPHSAEETPYGLMGWTTNNEILVYDKFDVWKVGVDSNTTKRLTNGIANKIRYRAYNFLYLGFQSTLNSKPLNGYNLSEDIVFSTQDPLYNEGYDIRKSNGKIEPLIREEGKISALRKAKFKDSYIYLKETNTDPPALTQLKKGKSKVLKQSNSQQYKYHIGKTELISYKNIDGEDLNGLLHYPDNYVPGKQYPMIVNIYEMEAKNYQTYQNPTLYRGDGFNYRNFTATGYFVLEPDILVKIGKPGLSALDCTLAAVHKVLELGVVDKNALGLIGSSFGGYETSFIISQTNLFSAAVTGCGVFDLTSVYYTLREDWGRPVHPIVENGQYQMEKSLYKNQEAYRNNSPSEFVEDINTPTLIWTGGADYQVDWHQSRTMYLALRLLDKDVELLIYENEPHSIINHQNQKDLSERIGRWFDKYLKNS